MNRPPPASRSPRRPPPRRRGGWRIVLGLAAVLSGAWALARALVWALVWVERQRERAAGAATPQKPRPAGAGAGAPGRRDEGAAAPPAVRRRAVAGPAGRLALVEAGAGGLPVLFVHGLGGSAQHWAAQLAHLAPRRRAVALDLRGHGDSAAAAEGESYAVEALAGDVAAVADALGLDRFLLAGHSFGAAVAIAYAARRPERVAGLLLVDANGDLSRLAPGEMASYLKSLAADPHGEMRFGFRPILLEAAPGVAEQVLSDLERTVPEALVGAMESAATYGAAADLGRYPGPALALVTPINSLAVSLHRLLPDLPVRHVLGTSHWLMMDRPEEADAALDELLAAVEGE